MARIDDKYTHRFTTDEMSRFLKQAADIHAHKRASGRHVEPAGKRVDSLEALTMALASEWLVASLLPGAKWMSENETFTPAAYDVEWRGHTIDVKTVNDPRRSLWVKEKNGCTADILVLVIRPERSALTVREWITKEDFDDHSYRYKPYEDRPAVLQVTKRNVYPFRTLFDLMPKGVVQEQLI